MEDEEPDLEEVLEESDSSGCGFEVLGFVVGAVLTYWAVISLRSCA